MPTRSGTAAQSAIGISAESISAIMDLIGGGSVTFVFASLESDAVNSDTGMLEDTGDFFKASSLVETYVAELADGDMTIAFETFLNDPADSNTRTRLFAAASNMSGPGVRESS